MASALDTSVKTYHNMMAGIPQLNKTRGRLVEFLDAVLVDGFGERTIDSATYVDGLLTLNIANNSFEEWKVVAISGFADPELDGEFRVVTSSSTGITIAVTGITEAPASTSGVTVKMAPLGYERYFSVGGKRVYRSKNLNSNKPCLVVHDEAMSGYTRPSLWAAVGVAQDTVGVEPEDFRGVSCPTRSGFPYTNWKPNVEAGRIGWFKWYYAYQGNEIVATDAGNLQYRVIGDDMLFFFETTYSPTWYAEGRTRYIFGEINAYNSADRVATIIVAEDTTAGNSPMTFPGERCNYGAAYGWATASRGWRILGSHDQLGESHAVWLSFTPLGADTAASPSGWSTQLTWPNPATGETLFIPMVVMSQGSGVRGDMPGMLYLPHDQIFFQDGQIIKSPPTQDSPGRRYMITKTRWSSASNGSATAFDVTGPWR